MKTYTLNTLLLASLLLLAMCTQKDNSYNLIPYPTHIESGKGLFKISEHNTVSFGQGLDHIEYDFLKAGIALKTGIAVQKVDEAGAIHLTLSNTVADEMKEEGYQLTVDKKQINIEAISPVGLFYGVQSLLQLIGADGTVPAVSITDEPRFAWRGFMLDVSRHFFPKEYIFKVLDQLAMHKMNTFHWHLVDDQGWRIEIKKYPKLTEVGAWRVDREHLHWNGRKKQQAGEKATYGGFYTQEDIKEIVAYASARHITIVPEIEMPAHTNAALAAYPEYSCTGGPFSVLPGGIWPITELYCAGKDETFDFLQDVLLEVMDLFPSPYIHIGGDEANKAEWEVCPDCQTRIREEGLSDEHELQSYFITRIEKFLNDNGRQLIGWDEILEGGLAPNAAVMSWRGIQGGIEAARSHHPAVMTPTSHCYFDYYQGSPDLEPQAFGGFIPLEKVYSFEPIPEELSLEEGSFIMGVQANLWTEYVHTPAEADYMTFPRLCALAEVAWTDVEQKDFDFFAQRLTKHLHYLDLYEVNYAKSFSNVAVETAFDMEAKEFQIELSNPISFGEIRYTLDESDPTAASALFSDPFALDKTTTVKAATFLDDIGYSAVSSEKVWIHKATGAQAQYMHPYSVKYPAGGDMALTNSLRGSKSLTDGRWQGFLENDLDVLVDLGAKKEIHKVTLGCLQTVGSWVFFPSSVAFILLDEQETELAREAITNQVSLQEAERLIQNFSASFTQRARYVRVVAKNQELCPDWHAGAGQPAWLFVDEIIIE